MDGLNAFMYACLDVCTYEYIIGLMDECIITEDLL